MTTCSAVTTATTPRLQSGDVVFVPAHWTRVQLAGEVIRPAIYELRPGREPARPTRGGREGFGAKALRRRVQIDRILPPAQREPGGRDRVVLDLASDQFIDGLGLGLSACPWRFGDGAGTWPNGAGI